MNSLEERVEKIEKRNKKVEDDKAWEGSWTRKIVLIIFTYLAVGFYLKVINVQNPWINAIVPSLGFLLSTLTLPFIKNWWKKNIYKK
ncbi:MAG: hypothetical protein COX79_03430 [Candidatus Levybacteria bacterium CG_4_10_14_0_2_um_filter_36_16]|nr:MAG: hypothetical protein AUK12_01695 [Candidatus Levybacteria bacterium CG2_30_37_29]PIZ97093.1 MAG: hypothetical protein COX79_03430 [Candidatus Levybacteria bacterium CG_4_10_14_0_2_um_filter_36_16]